MLYFLLVVSSRGMFSCWLLLVLEFLLPVAATVFVVLLVVGWGIDESIADIFSCRSMGLLLMLDCLLPVAATVFVALLVVG